MQLKNRPGRPPTGRTVQLNLRVTRETKDLFDTMYEEASSDYFGYRSGVGYKSDLIENALLFYASFNAQFKKSKTIVERDDAFREVMYHFWSELSDRGKDDFHWQIEGYKKSPIKHPPFYPGRRRNRLRYGRWST